MEIDRVPRAAVTTVGPRIANPGPQIPKQKGKLHVEPMDSMRAARRANGREWLSDHGSAPFGIIHPIKYESDESPKSITVRDASRDASPLPEPPSRDSQETSHGQAYPISDVANEISLMDVELKPFTEPTEPLEAAVPDAPSPTPENVEEPTNKPEQGLSLKLMRFLVRLSESASGGIAQLHRL